MARWFPFLGVVAASAALVFAADELPKQEPDESFEIEPPLLIPNRGNEPLPAPGAIAASDLPADPDRLEKQLERAKRSAAGAERLVKIGALAKVEAEQRAFRVVRLQGELADALLARAKDELAVQQSRLSAGEISKADLAETEAVVASAAEAARVAAENRKRAELEAAESNLHRQQKLLAMGSARKSDVNRAEQKLADLKAPKE